MRHVGHESSRKVPKKNMRQKQFNAKIAANPPRTDMMWSVRKIK